jgi:hypothetical protein
MVFLFQLGLQGNPFASVVITKRLRFPGDVSGIAANWALAVQGMRPALWPGKGSDAAPAPFFRAVIAVARASSPRTHCPESREE